MFLYNSIINSLIDRENKIRRRRRRGRKIGKTNSQVERVEGAESTVVKLLPPLCARAYSTFVLVTL
jgi:hypothetical protein